MINLALYDPRYPKVLPNKQISCQLGVKQSSVATILHDYKYGLIDFEMSDDECIDKSKKMTPEIISYMSNIVYTASRNKEIMNYKIIKQKLKEEKNLEVSLSSIGDICRNVLYFHVVRASSQP